MLLCKICRIYVSCHILFEGIHFVLSYSAHVWNAYVAGNLLKLKNWKKWSMPTTKTKHFHLFWKDSQNVTFHEPKSTLKIGYNWYHICGVMLVFFCFSAVGGARKLMKPKPHEFHFKLMSWPVRDVAIYTRCITAFSRLNLRWAVHNLKIYIKYFWLFRSRKQICHSLVEILEMYWMYNLPKTLHAQNDKENCVDLYISVFLGEANMCFGFISFRTPPTALKQKN